MTDFTKTDITNMALGHLGEYRIDDFDDSEDPSAISARTYWDIARLQALGAYKWGFASTIVQLTRNNDAPDAGYLYKYDQPTDWVRTIRVIPTAYFGEDDVFTRWEHRDGFFETDEENLYLHYVYDHDTVGTWPSWFVEYMSARLAGYLAPSVVTSANIASELKQMEKRELLSAKARDAGSNVRRRPKPGNWYRALRGQRTWT